MKIVIGDDDEVEELVHLVKLLTQEIKKMSQQLDELKARVASNTTVVESAIALIQGIGQRITDAVAAALAAGATPETLTQIQAVADELAAEDSKLADAIAANTTSA